MSRIVVAHPFPDLYGADRSLQSAIAALRDEGHDVVVVIPEHGPLVQALQADGVTVEILRFPVVRRAVLRPAALPLFLLATPWHVVRLARFVRRRRADVVYVNTLTLPHWLMAARIAGRPALCHVHEAQEQLGRLQGRVLIAPLLAAALVVANSDATRRWLTAHFLRLRSRTRVVRIGYRFGPVPPPPQRPADDPARIVLVGRLNPIKGQDTAIEATALLRAQGHQVVLELVGDVFRGYEPVRDQLREQSARLGIADQVVFTGFVADPTEAYRRADVVVIPSVIESFGMVAVEACAQARPVVASSVGGLPEIVVDGTTGLLIPPRDPQALATAVATLLADPSLARRLAISGAERVRSEFGFDRMARDICAAVEALS
jgi:glycosyltransferase involved in cell wall biosynthesis